MRRIFKKTLGPLFVIRGDHLQAIDRPAVVKGVVYIRLHIVSRAYPPRRYSISSFGAVRLCSRKRRHGFARICTVAGEVVGVDVNAFAGDFPSADLRSPNPSEKRPPRHRIGVQSGASRSEKVLHQSFPPMVSRFLCS